MIISTVHLYGRRMDDFGRFAQGDRGTPSTPRMG